MSENTVCCKKCGGFNVECAVWWNPNTGHVGEHFGSWNYGDNTFCSDCDENTDLVDAGAEPELFEKVQAARIRRCAKRLGNARRAFEANPTPQTAEAYLSLAMEYEADELIGVDTLEAARAATAAYAGASS